MLYCVRVELIIFVGIFTINAGLTVNKRKRFIMVSSISNSDSLAYLLKQLASSTSTTSDSSNALSAKDMFAKLSKELGGDGKTITKDQLESYIKTVESDTTGTYDKGSLGFLKQLDTNWNSISGGSDSITESDMAAGMSYLAPPAPPTESSSSSSAISDLFTSLSDATDSDSSGISKDDLVSYLKSLVSSLTSAESASDTSTSTSTTASSTDSTSSTTSTTDLANEIKFITNLLVNFDTFSGGSDKITSSSFYSALKEPQDVSTITSDQLTSPIDIRV